MSLPALTGRPGVTRLGTKRSIPNRGRRPRFRLEVVIPRYAAPVVLTTSLLLVAGCQVLPDTRADDHVAESAPYISLGEFASTLADKHDVVLIEFCVPSGCTRCDVMREPIDRLASDRREGLKVRRVNLNRYPQLLWEFKLDP